MPRDAVSRTANVERNDVGDRLVRLFCVPPEPVARGIACLGRHALQYLRIRARIFCRTVRREKKMLISVRLAFFFLTAKNPRALRISCP